MERRSFLDVISAISVSLFFPFRKAFWAKNSSAQKIIQSGLDVEWNRVQALFHEEAEILARMRELLSSDLEQGTDNHDRIADLAQSYFLVNQERMAVSDSYFKYSLEC